MRFVPGLELSRRFYWEAVRPALDRSFPGLPHAAALLGSGSETLGFDDEMSTDHSWGPRLQLFLRRQDREALAAKIDETLRRELPHRFLGYPTHFTEPDPTDDGTRLMRVTESGPVNHLVEMLTISGFFRSYLNFDVDRTVGPADWLTFPQQKLRSISAGGIFHDDIGLDCVRARLAWYPPDLWRYLLAAGWARIGQEEHLMGRAGLVGDELGSALIASRLVRDLMRLCFLMERQYAPYAKWFGKAFSQLDSAAHLTDALLAVQRAHTWQERDRWLGESYSCRGRPSQSAGAHRNDAGKDKSLLRAALPRHRVVRLCRCAAALDQRPGRGSAGPTPAHRQHRSVQRHYRSAGGNGVEGGAACIVHARAHVAHQSRQRNISGDFFYAFDTYQRAAGSAAPRAC